jgi:glycosyltransferase involved in cell wall biosynthesis
MSNNALPAMTQSQTTNFFMNNSALINCKLRVAIVGRLDQPGGVQSVILSLIKGLNQIGIIPDLIWDKAPSRKIIDQKNVFVNYLPIRFTVSTQWLDFLPVTARYFLRTANLIRSSQLPIHYDFYYIFYNGFLVDQAVQHIRYLSGPPLLPQLDRYSPGMRGIPYRALRFIYRNYLSHRRPVYEYHSDSSYVINAQYTASLFEEAHGIQLPVVYPPISISPATEEIEDFSSRTLTTFFSRFARYKRPEMLFQLASEHRQMKFLLMGGVKPVEESYYKSLVHQVIQAQLSNIRFLPTPDDSVVKEELSHTRFYVFPAKNEHFGMATVEAISSGAIPFVHDSGGQREIVPDTRLRFTDQTFSEKFSFLTNLPVDELTEIRRNLRNHIQQYSEEIFIEKMLSLLPIPIESEFSRESKTAKIYQ